MLDSDEIAVSTGQDLVDAMRPEEYVVEIDWDEPIYSSGLSGSWPSGYSAYDAQNVAHVPLQLIADVVGRAPRVKVAEIIDALERWIRDGCP